MRAPSPASEKLDRAARRVYRPVVAARSLNPRRAHSVDVPTAGTAVCVAFAGRRACPGAGRGGETEAPDARARGDPSREHVPRAVLDRLGARYASIRVVRRGPGLRGRRPDGATSRRPEPGHRGVDRRARGREAPARHDPRACARGDARGTERAGQGRLLPVRLVRHLGRGGRKSDRPRPRARQRTHLDRRGVPSRLRVLGSGRRTGEGRPLSRGRGHPVPPLHPGLRAGRRPDLRRGRHVGRERARLVHRGRVRTEQIRRPPEPQPGARLRSRRADDPRLQFARRPQQCDRRGVG